MKWTKDTCRPLATTAFNVIKKRLPELAAGRPKTAKKLCGDYWNTLTSAERRFLGHFISTCARQGSLELKQVGRNASNHWLYQIKKTKL